MKIELTDKQAVVLIDLIESEMEVVSDTAPSKTYMTHLEAIKAKLVDKRGDNHPGDGVDEWGG